MCCRAYRCIVSTGIRSGISMEVEGSGTGNAIFERVLVPTDFSKPARNTLDCVAGMPGMKEMVLYHAIDATRPSRHGWIYNRKIENARILLEEKKEQLGGRGFRIETRVKAIRGGDIATSILGTAEEEHVSLVVMGSRGRTLVKGLLLGSVSSDVLRFGTVPLLVLGHEFAGGLRPEDCSRRCKKILSRVLCATDFSPAADRCTAFLAGTRGIGEVILMHVVTKGETREEIENHVKEARVKLQGVADEFRATGHEPSLRVHVGDPVDEILHLAREEDVTLIAIGTVGKNWLKEILMGSTTLNVVRHANRPVLVLRVPVGAVPPAAPG
jgi:nucleotide-binding universal stress UspA family protein